MQPDRSPAPEAAEKVAGRPKCASCPYFDDMAEHAFAESTCRRHAPLGPPVYGQSPWGAVHREHWCGDHPDFVAWLGDRAATTDNIKRKIYHDTPEHDLYRAERFKERRGTSFKFDGHRWSYRHTGFDDDGEYDLIWRPHPALRTFEVTRPAPAPTADEGGASRGL